MPQFIWVVLALIPILGLSAWRIKRLFFSLPGKIQSEGKGSKLGGATDGIDSGYHYDPSRPISPPDMPPPYRPK